MLEETDHEAVRAEHRYRALGNVGLILVIIGSSLQALAVLIA
jgi:hypothetical protein